ncbi:uncharacterized protein SAPINGB_P000639 [Magnusiomyces paraingens]|uniref:Uncharacterized protein n=1 Tax=Magnusiomyces paraingens TaxID=2606893 RepID=A0A5E8B2H5_9ASCO|nr:uncharacterized protein SAPINGB_P000639 [Saprochaete ingens]VVT45105.1 unnamed protein product [Saprochaete ingens]
MVAIKNIAFFSAVAAIASAAPTAAASNEVARRSELSAAEILAPYAEINKRSNVDLSAVATLLANVGTFLQETLTNVLSGNLSLEPTSLATFLAQVNSVLLELENNLKSTDLTSGVGSLVQNLLIKTGLQTLVLNLSVIISNLVSRLLTGKDIDSSVKAQFTAILSTITSLQTTLKSDGLSSGVDGLLSNIIGDLNKIL